jgi:hypothetical protein
MGEAKTLGRFRGRDAFIKTRSALCGVGKKCGASFKGKVLREAAALHLRTLDR